MGNWFDSIMMLIPTDGWQRMMVDVLWQSTFVGVLALVVSRWLVRQAAARAWVLILALTACVFLPVTSFFVRSAGWAVPIYVGDTEFATLDSTQVGVSNSLKPNQAVRTFIAATTRNEASHVSHQLDPSNSHLPVRASMQTATKVTFLGRVLHSNFTLIMICGVWLSSSLFQLFRLVISAIAVRRMMRRSRPCEDTVLLKALSGASQRVGLTTTPRLLVSEQISAPMVIAYFQPALLIPTVTTTLRGEEQFTTTFAHELAHVRRRDGWARLWVQLITVLVPVQPLVWWMRKSFFEACEEACDDWAIAFGSDPVDLASVLTAWSDGYRNRRRVSIGGRDVRHSIAYPSFARDERRTIGDGLCALAILRRDGGNSLLRWTRIRTTAGSSRSS